jgi:DNA-binding MarR family transcriptional regulator
MPPDNTVRSWRSLLELGQAVQNVFEEEIPPQLGLPRFGLGVLRLLRWHGPKTRRVIGEFLGLSDALAAELVEQLIALDAVRLQAPADPPSAGVYEITPQGAELVRQVVDAQRQRAATVCGHLSAREREILLKSIEELTVALLRTSASVQSCAACWALDTRQCLREDAHRHCAVRIAGRALPAPDLREGPDHCPETTCCPTAGGAVSC